MTKGKTWAIVIISTLAILLLAVLISLSGIVSSGWLKIFPNPNISDPTASAAILALITGAAVGIERILETFWTIVGQIANTRWPLRLRTVGEQIDGFVVDMNRNLKPFEDRVQELVSPLRDAGDEIPENLQTAQRHLGEIKANMSEFEALYPYNPRAREAAAAASRGLGYLEGQIPSLRANARAFNTALGQLDDFLSSFSDNPARRLMSIYAGAFLGLLFAGILGLDVIEATLGTGYLDNTVFAKSNLGTAFTGLIMGLGATPTHEVIKTLQEVKKGRKAENKATTPPTT